MEKVKEILLIILTIAIILIITWLFFTIALPILLVTGLIVLIYSIIKKQTIFKIPKNKQKKKKDDIKEAIIIDEK